MKHRKRALFVILLAVLAMGLTGCIAAMNEQATATAVAMAALEAAESPVPSPSNSAVPEPSDTAAPEPSDTAVAEPTDTAVPGPTDTALPPPTDTPPPEPTEAPQPTESVGLSADALEQLASNLQGALEGEPSNLLDNIETNLTLAWNGIDSSGTQVTGIMTASTSFQQDPSARHVRLAGEFAGAEDLGMGEGQLLDIYVVDESAFMKNQGIWYMAPAGEVTLYVDEVPFAYSEEVLGSLPDWVFDGSTPWTTYDGGEIGLDTYSGEPVLLDVPEEMVVETAFGRVYIDPEANSVAGWELALGGSNMPVPGGQEEQILAEGTMEATFTLTQPNDPQDIQVPEEALASTQLPDDVPLPGGAEIDWASEGYFSFPSESTAEEIVEFYEAEMPNYGWSKVEEASQVYANDIVLVFSKGDNEAAAINVSLVDSRVTYSRQVVE